jgi:hypothetical protein
MDGKKNNITGSNFLLAGQPLLEVNSGDCYQVDYVIRLPMTEGVYSVEASLTEHITNFLDFVPDAVVFTVSRWENAKVWAKVYLFPSVDIETVSKTDLD